MEILVKADEMASRSNIRTRTGLARGDDHVKYKQFHDTFEVSSEKSSKKSRRPMQVGTRE